MISTCRILSLQILSTQRHRRKVKSNEPNASAPSFPRRDSIDLDDQSFQPSHQLFYSRRRLHLPLQLLDPPPLAQHSHHLSLRCARRRSLNRLELLSEKVCEEDVTFGRRLVSSSKFERDRGERTDLGKGSVSKGSSRRRGVEERVVLYISHSTVEMGRWSESLGRNWGIDTQCGYPSANEEKRKKRREALTTRRIQHISK